MLVPARPRSKRWLVAAVASVALAPVAACGSGAGADDPGSDEDSGRAQVIGRWQDEFCPTVQPDLVAEKMSYSRYVSGPVYDAMGSARTPNTFDCEAILEIDLPDDDAVRGHLAIGIYNGRQPARTGVEAYYRKRLTDWIGYYDDLEADSSERKARVEEDALEPVLDQELDGAWKEGHAYAMPSAGSHKGAVFAAVRNDDYALFITVDYPKDPEVRQAEEAVRFYEEQGEPPPDGLDPEGIESRRVMPFTEAEIVEWTVDEYVTTVYEAVEQKLGG